MTTEIVTGEMNPRRREGPPPARAGGLALRFQRGVLRFSRRWLAWVNAAWGVYVGLPWLAPVLMAGGARRVARINYLAYSTACHQLANRSFFLFGPQLTYSYAELAEHVPGADAWMALRAFVGTPELGYKVAWSDRMVTMYGGIFLGGLIYGLLRRRLRAPRWWVAVLLGAPMVVDGATHFVSDLAGVGRGFRYHNRWLAALTAHALPEAFYRGTQLGSFNSWMRLGTGLLFGWAIVWVLYPALGGLFDDVRKTLEDRLQDAT